MLKQIENVVLWGWKNDRKVRLILMSIAAYQFGWMLVRNGDRHEAERYEKQKELASVQNEIRVLEQQRDHVITAVRALSLSSDPVASEQLEAALVVPSHSALEGQTLSNQKGTADAVRTVTDPGTSSERVEVEEGPPTKPTVRRGFLV
ncbi:hypothetical protein FVE85_4472 [Porphyridium purpureum]|uniref:Uncharacterized protein n=1 Tax=Porphyridium purpureum TaxID=35688 RepID=A0A5J4YIT1_PORPP|nr:hypothetical protein FVE85_4472 [Porphyridium purpureum]|eukprot:POR2150..scf297_16